MTRFARGGSANKKKPNEASSWQELKKSSSQSSAAGGGSSKTSGSSGSLHRTDSKSANLKRKKKMGKNIVHSNSTCSNTISAGTRLTSIHVPTKCKLKNKTKSKRYQQKEIAAKKDSNQHQYEDKTTKYEQNSKSLIEELEEMDRQQMAEINKEQNNTNSIEQNKQLQKSRESLNKKERRREERRLKRQKAKLNKMVCFHCREPGHGVADCPRALTDVEQGTGVCYRCGSTEHDSSQCTARIDPNQGEFPFAKCFICQEMGHLSRSCPDNPKGLYPMGGCCKFCESVEHMSWNCPHNKKIKGSKAVHLSLYSSMCHQSADAEVFEAPRQPATTKKKQPKIVKF